MYRLYQDFSGVGLLIMLLKLKTYYSGVLNV